MLKNKPLFAFSILLLICLVADCRCIRRQITIKNVLLEIPSNASIFSNSLDKEKFSALLKKIIDQSPHFHFDANRNDGTTLRIALYPISDKADGSSITLAGTLSKSGNGDAKEHQSFADIKMVGGAVSSHEISSGLSRVLQNLYNLFSGLAVDNETFIKKINASIAGEAVDNNELLNAIAILGDTRDKKASGPLIKLLSSTSDLSVGNACLIALSAMRVEEAIPAIIEFVERKPPMIRRQAIIAAKRIASKLAAEWLLVMAYGYDDPVVRKEALSALHEVEEKLGLGAK